MKRNKKNIIIFGIALCFIIGILIVVKSISYFSIILPQLSQTKENQYKVPELCSDREVKRILEMNKGKDLVELYKIGNDLFQQKKYKEAYNIYKLGTQSNTDLDFPLDLAGYASLDVEMGECYRKILNNKQACHLADLAIDKMPIEADEFDIYYVYYTAAISYYDKEAFEGFTDSKKTIELLQKVLTLETKDVDRQQFYHDSRKQIYLWMIRLYSFSPSIYNREMAIKYYKEYLEFEPTEVYENYALGVCYLEQGDLAKAQECWKLLEENNVNKIDDYAFGAYYNVVSGDMKIAKAYLNKLKHIAVSHNAKSKYFYISALYYEKSGDKERAGEYIAKYVEQGNDEVYTHEVIELEKSLDINFDYIREKLAKERDANYSIVLDVEGY